MLYITVFYFFSDSLLDVSADLFNKPADQPVVETSSVLQELHEQSEDRSLEVSSIHEQPETQCSVQFELVDDLNKRGRVKLVDSRSYTFNLKR